MNNISWHLFSCNHIQNFAGQGNAYIAEKSNYKKEFCKYYFIRSHGRLGKIRGLS